MTQQTWKTYNTQNIVVSILYGVANNVVVWQLHIAKHTESRILAIR